MDRKKAQIVALDFHRRKLVMLVGELLEKADDIDRASDGSRQSLEAKWQAALAATCGELAALNEAVQGIEPLVKNGNVAATQESLLRCIDIANHLSRRLNELKRRLTEC